MNSLARPWQPAASRWLLAAAGWAVATAAALAAPAKHPHASLPPAAPPRATAAEPAVYSLAECLALALRENPDVLAAAKRVEAARASITAAKGPLYPSLSSSGFYQRREQSVATSGGITPGYRTDDYTGDVRLAQSLYSGGAVRNRIAAAKLQLRIEELAEAASLDAVALQVRTAFYQTLAAEASIGVRQQAVDLLGAQLKDQRDKLAAGSVGQVNVDRAQVALGNEQPALLDAQANVRASYANLSQLLGIAYPAGAANAPFRVRGALAYRPFDMTVSECLARALALRPEIESRKIALDVLNHLLVVEKAATRPQVAAFAAYDIYSEPYLNATSDNFSGYTLGVSASWLIFDGFATLGRVRGVRAQIGAAQAQLVAEKLQVENDVRTAYADLQQAAQTLQPEAQNISLANETLGLTTRNFDAGLSTQLDVLQSRVDLTRARTTELGGMLAYNVARARLERAMALDRPSQGAATGHAPASK